MTFPQNEIVCSIDIIDSQFNNMLKAEHKPELMEFFRMTFLQGSLALQDFLAGESIFDMPVANKWILDVDLV